MPSAGERRGSVGIAGRRRTRAGRTRRRRAPSGGAGCRCRWRHRRAGASPSAGGTGAGTRDRVVAACRCGRWLRPSSRLLSRDDLAVHRGPPTVLLHAIRPATGRVTCPHVRPPTRLSTNLPACPPVSPPRPRGRRLDWGRVRCGRRARGVARRSPSSAVAPSATRSTDAACRAGRWRRSARGPAWGVGAIALAVTGLVTLTAVARRRARSPSSSPASPPSPAAPAGSVLALAVPAAVAAVLVGAAEIGHVYIQASAYGDEHRFGLRPPLGLPRCRPWCRGRLGGRRARRAARLGGRRWVAGRASAPSCSPPDRSSCPRRWHQLTRRWLVIVPAGLVVHDPVVLADTLMMPTAPDHRASASIGRRSRPTGLDLTGPDAGRHRRHRRSSRSTTVVLAPRPATPRGTADPPRRRCSSPHPPRRRAARRPAAGRPRVTRCTCRRRWLVRRECSGSARGRGRLPRSRGPTEPHPRQRRPATARSVQTGRPTRLPSAMRCGPRLAIAANR